MLTSAPTNLCPDCGKPIPPASPEGLCAHCLGLSAAGTLFSLPATLETLSERRFFADYELLEELGRGGSGIVFKARQFGVNRIVALKLLSGGPAAGRDFVHRFHTEAAAAAQLEHPNIVPIYEFGEHEGAHYLAMRYIDGGTLADQLKTLSQTSSQTLSSASQADPPFINTQLQLGAPDAPAAKNCFNSFPPYEGAELLHKIALAVEHAHRRGILHRDLKPGNILLSRPNPNPNLNPNPSSSFPSFSSVEQITPYITDFGLARVLEHESSLTLTHSVLGTVAYLSPEVAAHGATAATTASDIYALGAILYELLTGRPPFQKPTIPATLRAIAEENPPPVGTRSTASHFSKSKIRNPKSETPLDLETICLKCLEKDPARRYASAQALADDLQRFLNNEPITARPITRTAKLIRWSQRNPALATAYSLLIVILILILIVSPLAIYRIDQSRKAEVSARERAQAEANTAELRAYTADMTLVQQFWDNGNCRRVQELLRDHIPLPGAKDLRGFEWRYLWKLCQDESSFSFTNFSAPVKFVLAPNRIVLAAFSASDIKFLDPVARRELLALRSPGPSPLSALAFSPTDTNLLAAAAGKDVQLWNVSQRRLVSALAFSNPPTALAFSGNGQSLAAVSGEGRTLELWDLPKRSQHSVRYVPNSIRSLAFAPDGKLVTGGGNLGHPLVWDLDGPDPAEFPSAQFGSVNSIVFSSDGRSLVTAAADDSVVLWNYPFLTTTVRFVVPNSGTTDAATFSPDGKKVAVAYEDGTIRAWDTRTGQQLALYRGHTSGVASVSFSSDGRSIFSASWDRTVKVWEAQPKGNPHVFTRERTWPANSNFSPDSTRMAIADSEGVVTVWDVAQHRKIAPLEDLPSAGQCRICAFSPDGKILAQNSVESVKLWDAHTFTLASDLVCGFDPISLSFTPDSRILAAAGSSAYDLRRVTNRLAFFDVSTRQRLNKLSAAAPLATIVTFSHDGHLVALGYYNGSIRLWNFATEKPLAEFHDQRQRIWALAFSPDDSLVAAGGLEGAVFFYDVVSKRALPRVARSSNWICGLAFSPDGKTLASAEGDGTLKLWNVASRAIALTLTGHAGFLTVGNCFSPDGNLLVSSGIDQTVRLWPAASTNEIPTYQNQ